MAEVTKRIYLVKSGKPSPAVNRLVRAANQAQALRHVVDDYFEVAQATQDECLALGADGVKVEDAKNGSAE